MSDLISREALIEEIKENQWGWFSREMLLLMLENQPSVTGTNVGDKWISCSERMPSEQDYPEQKYRVLASCSDGIVRNASIKSMLNGEKKYALGHIEFTYEAWMPLPPAFKGE